MFLEILLKVDENIRNNKIVGKNQVLKIGFAYS